MKPPPLLLGAALIFWGWQAEFFVAGAAMAAILEGARLVKARWEFSDEDFSRVWTFCSLLFLGAAVYAFTASEGPATFGSFFQNPNFRTQGGAGLSAARAGAAMLRWLPMIFFPFIAAQVFATRDTIPLATISFLVRRGRRKAQRAGRPVPPSRNVNIGYPYFAATLLAACVHPAENNTFFWGLSALLTWALWAQRSRRFGFAVWFGALILAMALGFAGQRGLGYLQQYLEKMNFSWLARFQRRDTDPLQSKTALGRIGRLKLSGQIVIRVEPKTGNRVPTYLREATYRLYRQGAVWVAGSARDDYQGVGEEPVSSGNWNILPGKSNVTSITIACYLEGSKSNSPAGLLPLPTGVGRLEQLPAFVLEKNDGSGAVLAQGPPLVIFDALYGPGATFDSLPGSFGATNRVRRTPHLTNDMPVFHSPERRTIFVTGSGPRSQSLTNEDLVVPEVEVPALDAMIDEMRLRGERDPAKILKTVAGFFAGNRFTYSLWQEPPSLQSTNETYLSRFLMETRAGHCEYYATATTLLLRRLDIPARYAVGYVIHESSGGGYVVRLRDAHAWCLVWDAERKIWRDFDTTPASWIEAENENKSPFQWLSDFWTRIGFEIARLKLRWTQGKLQPYVIWLIVPVLAWLIYQFFFRRGRRRKKMGDGKKEIFDWPGLDSEFYQLEKKLSARGVPRGDSEPMSDWLHRVAEAPGLTDLRAPLEGILRLHYRHRFDPLGLDAEDRDVLRREARACLEKLSKAEVTTT